MDNNQKPIVTSRKKIPGIWYIPIVALLIGLWMTVAHFRSLGPEVYIEFQNAAGIEPGKTKIKSLNVEVGVVESVKIKDDLKSVQVVAQLNRDAKLLLHTNTQFWVVRPRVTTAGISGLGTLLSGAYIELTPGSGDLVSDRKLQYIGLEEVPVTPFDTPGLHFTLTSKNSITVSTGDPVTYHGYKVGQVERTKLDAETEEIVIACFIKAPFDSLVTSTTKFWNASGISFEATAAGFDLQTESIESLIRGGITFGYPKDTGPGEPVDDKVEFELYPNEDSINEVVYQHYAQFLLLFDASVQGLEAGAPVTYSGVRIGTVDKVSFSIYSDNVLENIKASKTKEGAVRVPVLIRIEPGRWTGQDTAEQVAIVKNSIIKNVENGFHASIKMGNLLTGARLVAVDSYPDLKPGTIETFGGYETLPTLSSGLEDIEVKLSQILAKINSIPFEKISNDADIMLKKITATAATADATMQKLNSILASKETQQLPESINNTLKELKSVLEGFAPDSDMYRELNNSIEQLNATLHNIESITHSVDTKPSALIFSKPKQPDMQPEAPKQ